MIAFLASPGVLPPLQWALEHLAAIGWPVVCYCAWKIAGHIQRVQSRVEKTFDQVDGVAKQVNNLATNHFPHMQASLEKQDGLLHSMDGSLRSIATHGWNISVTPQKPKRQKREI
jgi:hypothetical protein